LPTPIKPIRTIGRAIGSRDKEGAAGMVAGAIHRRLRSGKSARDQQSKDVLLPRPVLILLVILVIVVGAMLALAALDSPVPLTHVEQPLDNAATH
jgi:hypothetical protein